MKTLTVKLKQHTPLIHFQHDQYGATLRASEVKPKLDRFILTKLGNGDYKKGCDEAHKNKWLIGEHNALNYKMKIIAPEVEYWDINEKQRYTRWHEQRNRPFINLENNRYLAKQRRVDGKMILDLKSYPLFFANMDADYTDNDEYRKFSFTEELLEVRIIFSQKFEDLYEYINNPELLNDFWYNTNFGTRQSKGFGSFSIDRDDPLYLPWQSQYRFEVRDLQNVEYLEDVYNKLFSDIELFYKTLRGGINLKNRNRETVFYFKSLAYKYAHGCLQAKWDKRVIKETFYGIDHEKMPYEYDVRDMLGFSTNEQWLSYGDSIIKTSTVADRMQSPIMFKPIYEFGNDDKSERFVVNIVFQDDKVNMQGFKDGKMINVRNRNGHTVNIQLPQQFSAESLFRYIFIDMNFDIYTHVENEYQNHEYFDILEDIYTQIKNNIEQK